MANDGPIPSSFRDPSGFLFHRKGKLFRQINLVYQADYNLLIDSGLYDRLVSSELLIQHSEIEIIPEDPSTPYKIILPDKIPFVSYPYEWCFSQLKDAALTTLKIQKIALEFGMSLKDASAYNIQFFKGKPILIDTLSFEKYRPNQPWVAYQQFCRHFFAPLLLMKFVDARLNKLMINFIAGIPLDLASSILSTYSFLRIGSFLHIFLQGKIESFLMNKQVNGKKHNLKYKSLISIIDNLTSFTNKLKIKLPKTEWGNYYENTNYSEEERPSKDSILFDFLKKIQPTYVWDFGANDGRLSRIASKMSIFTICFDSDHVAVEINYRKCIKNRESNLLPLMIDVTNPTPSIGWDNRERLSLIERGPTDTLIALALIHHLSFTNNLPLANIAKLFSKLCKHLIIEFVPKNDPQVVKMLANREDIFPDYCQLNFENAFGQYFNLLTHKNISNSSRIMYLFEKTNKS